MDFGDRRDLSLNGAGHERLEKGVFLFQCEVLMTPPPFARSLDGNHSLPVVGGNDPVNG